MKPTKDAAQCGNEKGVSIQHYLVKLIHKILTAVDDNSKKEAIAVIVQLINWKRAFDRQCHKKTSRFDILLFKAKLTG